MTQETLEYEAVYIEGVDEYPNFWASGAEKEKEMKTLRDETLSYEPQVYGTMYTCEVCGAQFVVINE